MGRQSGKRAQATLSQPPPNQSTPIIALQPPTDAHPHLSAAVSQGAGLPAPHVAAHYCLVPDLGQGAATPLLAGVGEWAALPIMGRALVAEEGLVAATGVKGVDGIEFERAHACTTMVPFVPKAAAWLTQRQSAPPPAHAHNLLHPEHV